MPRLYERLNSLDKALKPGDDGVLISLRVSPEAKRTGIEGTHGESAFKLKVAAPPVDGKANAEAEAFIAKLLGVRRSDVEVVRGVRSRDKKVLVRGGDLAGVRKALSEQT
ncbi:MAG: DUF167 domain-containing protein [Rubrobacteraceae bacterium]